MAMTFSEAVSRFPHRYTMENVPSWARTPAPNGKYYAPQFATDREWYENTVFPPNHPYGRHCKDCYTTGQTWPLGQWLDKPYVSGGEVKNGCTLREWLNDHA